MFREISERSARVVLFALTVVMRAGALTDTAKVDPQCDQTGIEQSTRG